MTSTYVFFLILMTLSASKGETLSDLVVVGPVQRTPEDGILKLYDPDAGSTLKCVRSGAEDLLVSDTRWYIVHQDDEEDLNVSSGTVDVSKHLEEVEEDSRSVVFRCRIGAEDYAEFRVLRSKPIKRSFRVKKFKQSYDVDIQMDEEFTCDIVNRTGPLEDILPDLKIKWYKWKVEEDFSYRPNSEEAAENSAKENCTEEYLHPNWIEITGDEIEEGDLEPHIKIFENQRVLKIEDARYSDRRGYKCVAFNISSPEKCSESSFFVRV